MAWGIEGKRNKQKRWKIKLCILNCIPLRNKYMEMTGRLSTVFMLKKKKTIAFLNSKNDYKAS